MKVRDLETEMVNDATDMHMITKDTYGKLYVKKYNDDQIL